MSRHIIASFKGTLVVLLLTVLSIPVASAQTDEQTRDQIAKLQQTINQLQTELELLTAKMTNNSDSRAAEIPPPPPTPHIPQAFPNSTFRPSLDGTMLAPQRAPIVDWGRLNPGYVPSGYPLEYYAPDHYYPYQSYGCGYDNYWLDGIGIGIGWYPSYGRSFGHRNHFGHPKKYRGKKFH